MSVIIKNREMPEGCVECWNRFSCKHFEISFIRLNTRHPDCPLINIPAPHGNLIDIDSRITVAIKDGLKITTVRMLLDEVAVRLPDTVIEADEVIE